MNRPTTLGIAGGITLVLAAAATAIGVNLGIMSDSGATQGPGTFQPTAAVVSDVTVPAGPADPGTVTVFVDENGNPIDSSTLSDGTTLVPSADAPDRSGMTPPSTIDDHRGSSGVEHDDDHSTDDHSTDDHSTDDHRSTDHEAGHDDDD